MTVARPSPAETPGREGYRPAAAAGIVVVGQNAPAEGGR